ncbi:MAG: type II toxin-antitoxin system HicB family antitoxin [Deltaproteobacteria bacterium]|nr:type II toxin-antitoxin system HicB family antitoxin [Deltaproteobacteria bacterium]
MTTRYKVSLKRSAEGFAVWVPGLPGCWSQGATQKEALDNIAVAIAEYLAVADDLSKKRKALSRYVEVRTHA